MNNLLSISNFALNYVNTLTNALGVWYLIIINAIGVLAIICKILEYQVKNRSVMFIFSTFANVCWVLYFALYGNIASTFTCVINVIKLLIFAQRGKHRWAESVWWLILFLVLQTVVTIFTVSSWVDVFCITAGYLGVLAYFFKDAKKYRLLSFFHMAIWVANSIANFYLIALLSDSFSTISCAIAICRFDLFNKKKKKEIAKPNGEDIDENKQQNSNVNE
jgi:hypothetical protein